MLLLITCHGRIMQRLAELLLASLLVWYFVFVCLFDSLLLKVPYTGFCSFSVYFLFSTKYHGKNDS